MEIFLRDLARIYTSFRKNIENSEHLGLHVRPGIQPDTSRQVSSAEPLYLWLRYKLRKLLHFSNKWMLNCYHCKYTVIQRIWKLFLPIRWSEKWRIWKSNEWFRDTVIICLSSISHLCLLQSSNCLNDIIDCYPM